jgi:uncharacterized protein (TIGR03382 family)
MEAYHVTGDPRRDLRGRGDDPQRRGGSATRWSPWEDITFAGRNQHDGLIYAIDGLTTNVHSFDPVTYAELNASFSSTNTKPVDLEFRPEIIPAPGVVGVVAAGALAVMRRRRR